MRHVSENETTLLRAEAGHRRHRGCFGCLVQILGALAFGVLVIYALTALLAPWAFYLGGSFHIFPYWQGSGILHAKSGDYPLYLQFEPSYRGGSRMYPTSRLSGIAHLCTPRGQRFRMKLSGDMRLNLPVHADGEAISFRLLNWPPFRGGFQASHRPLIDLVGHWKNPDLVLDDHSSLHRAFLADGSVIEKTPADLPYKGEVVPVTIKPGTY